MCLYLDEFYEISARETDNEIVHYLSPISYPDVCPYCGSDYVIRGDYTLRKVYDLPVRNKRVLLVIRSQRHRCGRCIKKFLPAYQSIRDRQRFTNRLVAAVLVDYKTYKNARLIARTYMMSEAGVRKILKRNGVLL